MQTFTHTRTKKIKIKDSIPYLGKLGAEIGRDLCHSPVDQRLGQMHGDPDLE